MVLVNVVMKRSGRCSTSSSYDETECKTAYPGSTFQSAGSWSSSVGGCFIKNPDTDKVVYYNRHAGNDCTNVRICLCKKEGKFTHCSISTTESD